MIRSFYSLYILKHQLRRAWLSFPKPANCHFVPIIHFPNPDGEETGGSSWTICKLASQWKAVLQHRASPLVWKWLLCEETCESKRDLFRRNTCKRNHNQIIMLSRSRDRKIENKTYLKFTLMKGLFTFPIWMGSEQVIQL